jgi:hypothetical protein
MLRTDLKSSPTDKHEFRVYFGKLFTLNRSMFAMFDSSFVTEDREDKEESKGWQSVHDTSSKKRCFAACICISSEGERGK